MIQIDISMPKNCLDCPVCNEYLMCSIPVNGRKWGENDVREYENGRPEWCPMKEQDELLKHEYWRGYNNGRADERGLQEGTIMQTFNPD